MSTATLGSSQQAIPGAETRAERTVIARWPSIASTGIGRAIGSLLESAPSVRLTGLNFNLALAPALLLAPIGAASYLGLKITGRRYTGTSKRVLIQGSLTKKLLAEVPLENIGEVAVAPYRDGQEFFQAADVVLQSASGDELMRFEAVTQPGVFRQNILESRDALVQVQEALATIEARNDG